MPRTYYQVIYPNGTYVLGGDYRPMRYRIYTAAVNKARLLSAQYGCAVEVEKYPIPYKARRMFYVA